MPTHAVAPAGAVQCAASCLILHFVCPAFVTQHVTAPGFPHVDRAAQRFSALAHDLFARRDTCCATHFSYAPWLVAVAQSQYAAIAARAFAMSVLSGSVVGSQVARATGATPRTSERQKPA